MKKLLMIGALVTIISGCGSDRFERVVETNTIQLPPAEVDEITEVITQENEYRMAAGQAPLTKGLVCTLHNVSTTTPSSIPSSPPAGIATFVYQGAFNQLESSTSAGLNILPTALKSVYKNWIVVKCQGQIVITESDYIMFNLTSDDGSNLYIDGTLLVDNNGLHGTQLRSASKLLKRGVHTFRLDYLQGNGNQSLILEDSNGLIPAAKFYR